MQPPTEYKNAGTMMIISGAFNVMTSLGILLGLAISLFGLCVAPIWLLTLGGGIMELLVGANINAGKPSRMGLSTAVVGLVCSVCCGNVIGMILEILAMVNLGKPEVTAWLADPGEHPALPGPGAGHAGARPPGHRPPEASPAASAAREEPPPAPADFTPRPRGRVGPSVSWSGDLELVKKAE